MSRDEIREFFYTEGLIAFDRTPCPGFSLDEDLDEEVWALFRERAKIPETIEPEIALGNLGLLRGDGRMTRAGAWLLARDIRKFQASGDVSCALFLGTTKTRILDRRDFHRDVYSMADDAVAWALSKINIEYIIRKVKREERPELPEDAIREAVVNAVAHRDYRSNANVQVHVFHDRLELVSPGGLPAGMTEADLGLRSFPRNALLFAMLHRMGAVERVGSGIRRIRDLCRAQGLAAPRIETTPHWVTMIFRRSPGARGSLLPATEEAASFRRSHVVSPAGFESERPESKPKQTESEPERPESRSDQPESDGGATASRWPRSRGPFQPLAVRVLSSLRNGPLAKSGIAAALGQRAVSGSLNHTIRKLVADGAIRPTIPDRPSSRLQQYRLASEGRRRLGQLEAEPEDADPPGPAVRVGR